ncbi:hypothetical protein B0J15DRAFT_353003, partial [Fusarium solani]
MTSLRMDEPYGAPAEDVFDTEKATLMGAGMGIRPWTSVLKNIWHMRNNNNGLECLLRVEFIFM